MRETTHQQHYPPPQIKKITKLYCENDLATISVFVGWFIASVLLSQYNDKFNDSMV